MAYNQNRKDRMDERRGMEDRNYRKKDKMSYREGGDKRDFVTGHDPEIGRDDTSGMPRDTVMEMYPKSHMYAGAYLDDSMAGIDATQIDSADQTRRHLSHQK